MLKQIVSKITLTALLAVSCVPLTSPLHGMNKQKGLPAEITHAKAGHAGKTKQKAQQVIKTVQGKLSHYTETGELEKMNLWKQRAYWVEAVPAESLAQCIVLGDNGREKLNEQTLDAFILQAAAQHIRSNIQREIDLCQEQIDGLETLKVDGENQDSLLQQHNALTAKRAELEARSYWAGLANAEQIVACGDDREAWRKLGAELDKSPYDLYKSAFVNFINHCNILFSTIEVIQASTELPDQQRATLKEQYTEIENAIKENRERKDKLDSSLNKEELIEQANNLASAIVDVKGMIHALYTDYEKTLFSEEQRMDIDNALRDYNPEKTNAGTLSAEDLARIQARQAHSNNGSPAVETKVEAAKEAEVKANSEIASFEEVAGSLFDTSFEEIYGAERKVEAAKQAETKADFAQDKEEPKSSSNVDSKRRVDNKNADADRQAAEAARKAAAKAAYDDAVAKFPAPKTRFIQEFEKSLKTDLIKRQLKRLKVKALTQDQLNTLDAEIGRMDIAALYDQWNNLIENCKKARVGGFYARWKNREAIHHTIQKSINDFISFANSQKGFLSDTTITGEELYAHAEYANKNWFARKATFQNLKRITFVGLIAAIGAYAYYKRTTSR